MNVMLKNLKLNCDMHSVAPFAAFAISNDDFNAGPFGSAFFLPSVILSAAKDPGQFNTRFLINN